MKRIIFLAILLAVVLMTFASPVFAQDVEPVDEYLTTYDTWRLYIEDGEYPELVRSSAYPGIDGPPLVVSHVESWTIYAGYTGEYLGMGKSNGRRVAFLFEKLALVISEDATEVDFVRRDS